MSGIEFMWIGMGGRTNDSKHLTLKKEPDAVRCAVVNGGWGYSGGSQLSGKERESERMTISGNHRPPYMAEELDGDL